MTPRYAKPVRPGHEPRAEATPASRLVNRNVFSLRGRTSMRLEPELWDALQDICRREASSITDIVQRIEARGHPGGRTSAVRVFVVEYFRALAGGSHTPLTTASVAPGGWHAGPAAREAAA
ncbi:MAG: ribbon-helix-helix domain-containing protein [Rhodospirillales bacterium]|nr:ribbon-helix-helix domain-containing protein [Rhodospirillales bacterium]